MFGIQKSKERPRFYLLPGQGGKAARRKEKMFLIWAVVCGLFASAAVAGVLYLISGAAN
jgi:hypothetical protein